jgi:hypothetical protein
MDVRPDHHARQRAGGHLVAAMDEGHPDRRGIPEPGCQLVDGNMSGDPIMCWFVTYEGECGPMMTARLVVDEADDDG